MPKKPPAPELFDNWPPEGAEGWIGEYEENLDGQPVRTFDVALPLTFAKVDMSTVRIGRHGGPNDRDRRFQRNLYERIGAIVVASGHVETAMKRLILTLEAPETEAPPEADFSLVDETWTGLNNRLRRLADGSTDRRTELEAVLDWGDAKEVKRRRDDAVHAYWWTYSGAGVRRSRFRRRSGGVTMFGTFEILSEDADVLFEYADKLDALLGSDWVIARLRPT